jgi:uncharacterized protein (DUF433 family)
MATMKIDDVFDGSLDGGLRIRGTRIGVDILVRAFENGLSPEEIVHRYHPALSLQQVYEAITCYLQHRVEIDAYCAELDAEEDRAVAAQQANPSELVKRIREVKRRREAA